MNSTLYCPVCFNANGGTCRMVSTNGRDSSGFECDVCGKFEISQSVFSGPLDPEKASLTAIQRAALSHRLRTASLEGTKLIVTDYWLKHFLADTNLPTPAIQAANIIRFVGDEISRSGELVAKLPVAFPAIVGAPGAEFAGRLAKELCQRGLLDAIDASTMDGTELINVNLTLDGWAQYEAEKRGRVAGKYGFIAMRFGDSMLDPFVEAVVKPAVKEGIGYDVVDMRSVARAGIIDNIMRAQIRDAAFVIVDLTHDNAGAYWEAGYAEGLGKPVVYICEKAKFEEAKTHFDTNHCTTVLWSQGEPDEFGQELVATLRRSLNLFPGA